MKLYLCSVKELFCFQGEHIERQILQTVTLLKSIFLLTSRPVNIFIINNDQNLFEDIAEKVRGWNANADKVLRFEYLHRIGSLCHDSG